MYELTSQSALLHFVFFSIGVGLVIYGMRYFRAIKGKWHIGIIKIVIIGIGWILIARAVCYALFSLAVYIWCLLICYNSPLIKLLS